MHQTDFKRAVLVHLEVAVGEIFGEESAAVDPSECNDDGVGLEEAFGLKAVHQIVVGREFTG